MKLMPMLAKSFDRRKHQIKPGVFTAEFKYDGFRLVIDRTQDGKVSTWSRLGNDCNHRLSPQLIQSLLRLPAGIFDGELILPGEGTYSSDVATKGNSGKLKVVIFDVLELLGNEAMSRPQSYRRGLLEQIFATLDLPGLELAPSWNLTSLDHLDEVVGEIWDKGGEGVIIKRTSATYSAGKRSDAFLKLKEKDDAVMTIMGFAPSEGEKNNRGAYGMTVLKDDEGNFTVVKTKNDEWLARLQKEEPAGEPLWAEVRIGARKVIYRTTHPRVGEKLRIEFQRRTPDGSYRHPRWDKMGAE